MTKEQCKVCEGLCCGEIPRLNAEIERLRAEIRSLDQANGGALQEIERLRETLSYATLTPNAPAEQFKAVLDAAEKGEPVNAQDLINALWWRVRNQRGELRKKNQEVERLRNDIQELTCGDPSLVSAAPEPGETMTRENAIDQTFERLVANAIAQAAQWSPESGVRPPELKKALDELAAYYYRQKGATPIGRQNPLEKNLQFLRDVIAFAYEHGYHEHGYDVLEEILEQLGYPRLVSSSHEPNPLPSPDFGPTGTVEGLRAYIHEQLGFLTDDDNRPAEALLRLAVKRLGAQSTSAPCNHPRIIGVGDTSGKMRCTCQACGAIIFDYTASAPSAAENAASAPSHEGAVEATGGAVQSVVYRLEHWEIDSPDEEGLYELLVDASSEIKCLRTIVDAIPKRPHTTAEDSTGGAVYRKWPGEPPHCMSCDCGMTEEQKRTVPFDDYKSLHTALMAIKYESKSLEDAQQRASDALAHKPPVHTTAEDYDHFLFYSDLQPTPALKWAFFAGRGENECGGVTYSHLAGQSAFLLSVQSGEIGRATVSAEPNGNSGNSFEFTPLKDEVDEPMSRADVDFEKVRWETKWHALQALCEVHKSGKGDQQTTKCLHAIAAQIANL